MLPLLGSLNFYQLLRQDVDRQKAAIAESRRRAAKRGREHATGGIHDGPLACGGCRRTESSGIDRKPCSNLDERFAGLSVGKELGQGGISGLLRDTGSCSDGRGRLGGIWQL